jgi:hypothetical protein
MEFLKSLYNVYDLKDITPERVQTMIEMCRRDRRIIFLTRDSDIIKKLMFEYYQRMYAPNIDYFILHSDNYHFGNFDTMLKTESEIKRVLEPDYQCPVCNEKDKNSDVCSQCKNSVCKDCSNRSVECPLCRFPFADKFQVMLVLDENNNVISKIN